jgi:hypothetical protein
MDKDETLTIIASIILLFTALINWNIYSWLILVGIVFIVSVWYLRRTEKKTAEQST